MQPEDLPDDVRAKFERRAKRAILVLWAIFLLEIASGAAVIVLWSRGHIGHEAFVLWLTLTLAVSRFALNLWSLVTNRALTPPDSPA